MICVAKMAARLAALALTQFEPASPEVQSVSRYTPGHKEDFGACLIWSPGRFVAAEF